MDYYDYLGAEVDDIVAYLHGLPADSRQDYLKHDEEFFVDHFYCLAFYENSITGNKRGSYTANPIVAEENLVGNWELLRAAIESLDPTFNTVKEGAEACDVLVRLYLLPAAINLAYQAITHH